MDEVLSIPTQEAAHVALMTQHILANETGIADVVDPLAGSYYVETLTNQTEAKAMELVQIIEEKGGAQKAIEQGFYQKLMREAAGQYQKEIETGERVIVGQNKFVEQNEKMKIASFKSDSGVQERVIQKLCQLKQSRDNQKVASSLRALDEDARLGKNTVPSLIHCARSYATIGEMCQVLGKIWGFYQEGATWL